MDIHLKSHWEIIHRKGELMDFFFFLQKTHRIRSSLHFTTEPLYIQMRQESPVY